ncbi:hypothetical protein TanjilG_32397 [Lupinus angustifolius]|nr:hypothetical protein TanjilG_32397 [Lupinus angustifolius]
MVGVLKPLKPVLDDLMDYEIPLSENMSKECQELDMQVLQSGTLLIKLQCTSLDICHLIVKSLQSPTPASVLSNLQNYIQEIQCLKKESAIVYIEEALRNQRNNIKPCNEHLKEIIELLKLTSNQELLKESIAVEKERLNAEVKKLKPNLEEVNEIVNLVRNLRDYMMKTECTEVKSSDSIPSYFRCPLSLELMLDPVVVASGQTYERQSIRKWLDRGINEDNKTLIMEAGAIDPLIHVLKTGNDGAKENSAAALFSLYVIENNKAKIGRSGAVKALVDLLASGTLRGKKDAATTLYNLSIFHENKARIVQAGAVKFLVQMMERADGMVDKAIALLSNLSTISEGWLETAREGGIPLLVEILESGSQMGKENSASILLQLCLHSSKFCTLVLQEGAVPPLVALSQSDDSLSQGLAHACGVGSLPSSNSISRSSLQTGNTFDKQKDDNSYRLSEEHNGCRSGAAEKFEQHSPYIHSRSEFFSSTISSTDCLLPVSKEVSWISNQHSCARAISREVTNVSVALPVKKQSGISPWLSGKQFECPGSKIGGLMENGNNNSSHTNNSHLSVDSRHVSTSGSDELTAASHVNTLIQDLHGQSKKVQTTAAEELKLLTKHNMENRLIINEDNKTLIMEAGAIDPLIHVLKTGNDGAKENSAAALFSLYVIENNKAKIGRSGAVKALVDLLASGTLRGKKDAATTLYNLSIFHENKARIVQAGAVKFLVQMMERADGMVDKAIALLSNLSTISEGWLETAREGGIPLLVEILESGSQMGKENSASILLQLCLHSSKFCTLVLQEGAVPPLVALSQSGTPRAKEKAQQLLSHFRNQPEGATGKGKS